MLNILDEFSHECLAIRVNCRLNSTDVVGALTDLQILRGVLAFIHSENGPEFIVEIVRNWIIVVGIKTAYTHSVSLGKTAIVRALTEDCAMA
tara:strand:+ start:373 stop:648 length:276 start_codon:yes stop_codon:yes gene_type:complete